MSQQKTCSGSTPNFLVEFLLTQWDASKNDFIPSFYEQFVNKTGFLNFYRIKDITGQFITQNLVKSALKQLDLSLPLVQKNTPTNQVTKEEFYKEYEFAKYPKTHMWIGHFAGKGKLLTWESLVSYLEVLEVQRTNFDHSTVNYL